MIGKLTSAGSRREWRVKVAGGIALVAWLLAVGVSELMLGASGTENAGIGGRAMEFFYDAYYRMRPEQDMRGSEVVLVAVDQESLTQVDKRFKKGWPWPREFWGHIASYVDRAGAKAIAFDILFSETSAYQNDTGDDDTFADMMAKVKTPVVWGSMVRRVGATTQPAPTRDLGTGAGEWEHFAPPVKNPVFGAVNVGDDKVFRRYFAEVMGKPSMAVETVGRLADARPDLERPEGFLLRYYGPHRRADGHQTFTYIPAFKVLGADLDGPEGEKTYGVSPAAFQGKIVILCAIATGTFDLKSTPLSTEYPGPEVQATAMENLLHGERVEVTPRGVVWVVSLLCALGVSAGVVLPRRASVKMVTPVGVAGLLLGSGALLFHGGTVVWLEPVTGLLAVAVTWPLAFGWTYFVEDRQRRFMLKALSKVVSPAVAEQLSREPERLVLGTVRTQITVLFTDLANFTDLSEGMDVQTLGRLVNRYLGEMSDQVLRQDGTLDKYIGDAVMCFWNAPLVQADHAVRACRTALGMKQREHELHGEFTELGTKHIFTRIGINTASVAVGFIGSEHLYNYTALGDGVNLASRLEGASKIYGTQILISENTAELVRAVFRLRKVDVLRVKGKLEPMAVYELLGERAGEEAAWGELAQAYESALGLYQAQRWADAEAKLLELCTRFGEDGPSMVLLERVRGFRVTPPAAEWDGVFVSDEK